MLLHYIKIAFRNLWKYKVQNLIGIVGLAVGIIVFVIAGCIVSFFTGYDTHWEDHEQMYVLELTEDVAYPGDPYDLLKSFPEIESMTSMMDLVVSHMKLVDEGKEKVFDTGLADTDTSLIDFLRLTFVAGSREAVINTLNSIVLQERAVKQYGLISDSIVGKVVRFMNQEYTITGVIQDIPRNSSFRSTGFMFNTTRGYYEPNGMSEWNKRSFHLLCVKLDNNATREALEEKLGDKAVRVAPIREYGFQKNANTTQLLVIVVVGLLVLLVALFNYVSFQTAQFYNRLKECAVRKVNGAGRLQQFLLFYVEVCLVILLSGIVGFLLLDIWESLFSSYYVQFGVSLTTGIIQKQFFLYIICGLIIAGFVCIAPAAMINRLSTRTVLLGMNEKGKKNIVRDVLLFVQLMILLAFMSASLIIHFQTTRMTNNIYHTLTKEEQQSIMQVSFRFRSNYVKGNEETLMKNISASPYVRDIIATPDEITNNVLSSLAVGPNQEDTVIVYRIGAPLNYFDFMNLIVRPGHSFSDTDDLMTMLVSESLMKHYPDDNPVGYTIDNGYYGKQVIGVVENVSIGRMDPRRIYSVIYEQALPEIANFFYVKFVPGKEKEVREHIDTCLHEFIPEGFNAIDLPPMSFYDRIQREMRNENNMAATATLFFVISLIIGLLSIYSAVAMNTEKRRKEIAIRKINGATLYDIILLFYRKYIILWTAVCVLVFPFVYYYGNNWLANYLDRIKLDVFFFAGIYIIVLLLILLTILFKVLQVARGELRVKS